MAKYRIKRGDEVVVIAGKDKGARGKVLAVDPKKGRVKVEGIGLVKKHFRPTQKDLKGGIREIEAFIHISNVRLWDPKKQAPCRVTVKRLEDGRKVRVSRLSGEILD